MNKLTILSVFFAATFVTISSYNFDDSYFNTMLAADLDEWRISSGNYVPQHSRARRDEEAMAHPDKCRRRRYKPCCTTESMDSIHMNEKEHKKECLKEIYGKEKDVEDHYDPFKCDKVNKHRKDMTCYIKCMSQKQNLVDEEGDIIETKLVEYGKDKIKESWLMAVFEKAVPKCMAESKNATTSHKAEADACNPSAIRMAHCLFKDIQLNCPEDAIKDAKSCAKFKERVKRNEEFISSLDEH